MLPKTMSGEAYFLSSGTPALTSPSRNSSTKSPSISSEYALIAKLVGSDSRPANSKTKLLCWGTIFWKTLLVLATSSGVKIPLAVLTFWIVR